MPAPSVRHGEAGGRDRGRSAGRKGAHPGADRALRQGGSGDPGEPGVSAYGRRPVELREADGQGERPHLRGDSEGLRESHHHARMTNAGAFIAVEGPEGAGKSTLVRALGARLLAEGLQVLPVREPGGTPVAEAARKLALRSRHELGPAAELFLILAARA